MLDKKVDAINHKLDKIIVAKNNTDHWNCHVNIDNGKLIKIN